MEVGLLCPSFILTVMNGIVELLAICRSLQQCKQERMNGNGRLGHSIAAVKSHCFAGNAMSHESLDSVAPFLEVQPINHATFCGCLWQEAVGVKCRCTCYLAAVQVFAAKVKQMCK